MNERIFELAKQAYVNVITTNGLEHIVDGCYIISPDKLEKFAELLISESCAALWTEECHTSDLAFEEVKRNEARIKQHFGIDPDKITIEMLDRTIAWCEQQRAEKN